MKYRRKDAKAYAREHLRGIWAAALTPFTPELRLDYVGWRRNLRYWYRDLGIAGIFVNGKQGEFYAMTNEERKRTAEAAVAEKAGGVMVSCSDQSLDSVLELARAARGGRSFRRPHLSTQWYAHAAVAAQCADHR